MSRTAQIIGDSFIPRIGKGLPPVETFGTVSSSIMEYEFPTALALGTREAVAAREHAEESAPCSRGCRWKRRRLPRY